MEYITKIYKYVTIQHKCSDCLTNNYGRYSDCLREDPFTGRMSTCSHSEYRELQDNKWVKSHISYHDFIALDEIHIDNVTYHVDALTTEYDVREKLSLISEERTEEEIVFPKHTVELPF